MNIPTQAEFVRQIDSFLDRHDMKESRLAREATGEPGLIAAIRSGRRSPTLNTVEKLTSFMARVDEEAAVQAKLHPPIDGVRQEEEDIPLPFANAPQGASSSSPTSSPTTEPQTSPGASTSCPACSTEFARDAAPATPASCSAAEESLVASPSMPTEAGE